MLVKIDTQYSLSRLRMYTSYVDFGCICKITKLKTFVYVEKEVYIRLKI